MVSPPQGEKFIHATRRREAEDVNVGDLTALKMNGCNSPKNHPIEPNLDAWGSLDVWVFFSRSFSRVGPGRDLEGGEKNDDDTKPPQKSKINRGKKTSEGTLCVKMMTILTCV